MSATTAAASSRRCCSSAWPATRSASPTGAKNRTPRPMPCLINEGSGSDGDIFPYMFRQLGLGPLIGTRTWGGVVGINDHGPMLDGGQIFVPEAGSVSLQGQW